MALVGWVGFFWLTFFIFYSHPVSFHGSFSFLQSIKKMEKLGETQEKVPSPWSAGQNQPFLQGERRSDSADQKGENSSPS